ncbi:hypothetical protein HK105_201214 [Polyrhizophydium stewartii]|uniref:DUF4436 domain-containing protein n=1 Tax=Polyrhizophydium stewartii TaxID=2732419 RepID=A0ABR4NHK3_9FUNG
MHLKRSHLMQLAALSVVLLLLVVLVPVSTVLNETEGSRRLQQPAITPTNPYRLLETQDESWFTGMLVVGNVSAIDVTNFAVKLHLQYFPWGNISATASSSQEVPLRRFNNDYRFIINGNPVELKRDSLVQASDPSVSILEGSPNQYPFDTYRLEFLVSAVIGQGLSNPLPFAMGLVGAVQSWTIDIEIMDYQQDYHLAFVTMTLRRSWTTKFFSMIVVIVMWALSLATLALAITLWMRGRKVEPPTIAVAGGLLFALPALRNAQPGAPPIGSSVDVAGFMWNMVLVAVATLLLVVNYVVKYRREKPACTASAPLLPQAPHAPHAPQLPPTTKQTAADLPRDSANTVDMA